MKLEGAFKSFDIECDMLRNIRHRNLARVISVCSNLDFKALVLEYMPNGSLENWLHSFNRFLDFQQRLDIMVDVAHALDYLHCGYSNPVVHCDLKPSNVLLDEDMVAHVSDFGISKFSREGDNILQTNTLGTMGYIAPEYGQQGLVSTSCDVYSFGILLMEVFTRKKPVDEMFTSDLSLKHWVSEALQNDVTRVIDSSLVRKEEEQFATKVSCVSSIFELALNCSAESREKRISTKHALALLKKIRLEFLANMSKT